MVNLTSLFAFLDSIGGMEMILIFGLSLMLFGGKKLPEVARGLGKAVREFKRAASGVENEIRRAIDMESPPASNRPKPPASPPRKHPPITDPAITPDPTPAPTPTPAPGTVAQTPEPDLAEDFDDLSPDTSKKSPDSTDKAD